MTIEKKKRPINVWVTSKDKNGKELISTYSGKKLKIMTAIVNEDIKAGTKLKAFIDAGKSKLKETDPDFGFQFDKGKPNAKVVEPEKTKVEEKKDEDDDFAF